MCAGKPKVAFVCVHNSCRSQIAEALGKKGIKIFDALHIACAVQSECDVFLTTDKKLLNTPQNDIRVMNPLDFIREMEG